MWGMINGHAFLEANLYSFSTLGPWLLAIALSCEVAASYLLLGGVYII